MIDEQKLEKAFDDFEAGIKAGGAGVAQPLAANVDLCGTWHNIRGTVDTIISGLRALARLFPIAGRAADVLDTLKNILNALCP